ncbi:MAG: TlpA family protein disulfide reductase [Candidatus Latescibacterota bacterium]|nr:MAG: TlpA family protein disulfide reductase [Candidatus Latescibacterota bacterium]
MSRIRVAALLLFGFFVLTGCSKEEADTSTLKAPAFSLLTADGGRTISLSDYKGKVLILNFWATWCPPCKKEIPHFNELYEQYKGEGLEVLGVSVDQGGPSIVETYMKSTPPSLIPQYPVVMADREVAASYGPIGSIPVTFVIDRKGNVQKRLLGYQDKETSEAIIQKLL